MSEAQSRASTAKTLCSINSNTSVNRENESTNMANNNELLLLKRCASKLDHMYHINRDDRPKSLEKLKNTLQKETQIIFVNQIVTVLLTLDNEIPLRNEESIYMSGSELEVEIADRAARYARETKRQLFVLPCDSVLHTDVRTKLKTWYENRPEGIDPTDPVREIMSACTVDTCLDVESILRCLQNIGILQLWLDHVSIHLPDREAFLSLQGVWDTWQDKVRTNLSEACASTYKLFANLLREANETIQNAKLEELREYCEKIYLSKYPGYKRSKSDDTERMEVEERAQNVDSGDAAGKVGIINTSVPLWSVRIDPSLAFVLLKLHELTTLPKTKQDLVQFIRSIADITYVVSPRHLLLELSGHETTEANDEQMPLNIRLGKKAAPKSFCTRDTLTLTSMLKFPGKDKLLIGQGFQRRRSFDNVDMSADEPKQVLQMFQGYVLKKVKQLSLRSGSTLVFGDHDSNFRCRASVQQYFASLSGRDGFTEEEFTQEIIERSFEVSQIPVEQLVKLLENAGYLQINDLGGVMYRQVFHKPKFVDSVEAERKYLTEWEQFYRPSQTLNSSIQGSLGRKRKMEVPYLFQYKRQRVIEI